MLGVKEGELFDQWYINGFLFAHWCVGILISIIYFLFAKDVNFKMFEVMQNKKKIQYFYVTIT